MTEISLGFQVYTNPAAACNESRSANTRFNPRIRLIVQLYLNELRISSGLIRLLCLVKRILARIEPVSGRQDRTGSADVEALLFY